jgi:5'-deoxynucleotidase YfbR-like HD superfamily hydrolase
VDNFRHMRLTYKIAQHFLGEHQKARPTDLSEDEKKILLMTSLVHDWGEAVTGDISFDLKTEAHEKEEILRFRQILAELLGNRFSETIRNQLVEIAHSRDTKLGAMFNIIERIGYLRTGLKAWSARSRTTESPLKNAFGWLANNVAGNQIPPLVNSAEKYPPVRN